MNKDNILVSVIMPVYNSQQYLHDAINSVLAQTYINLELILVDDGSKDESPQICDDFVKIDERVRVFHKKNGGVCSARNLGLKEANGEYVTFIDNDDLYDSRLLEVLIKQINLNKTDIIKCGRKNTSVDRDGKTIESRVSAWNRTQVFDKNQLLEKYYELKRTGLLSSVWNGLYRKKFLEENGINFNERFRHGNEDVYFNIVCFLKCEQLTVVKEVLYEHFYRNAHSTSLKYHPDQIADRLETIKLEERFIEQLKNSRVYELIVMGNIRVCFKLLSVSDDKEQRKDGIKSIESCMPLEQFKSFRVLKSADLGNIEKLELILLKHHLYDIYFMLQAVKQKR